MVLLVGCRSLSDLHRDLYLVMEAWFVLKGWDTLYIFASSVGARTLSPSVSCFLKCVFSNEAMWFLALSPRMTCKELSSPTQETWYFWSMAPCIFSPANWHSGCLIREVHSCIHLLRFAVPVPFRVLIKVPRRCVLLSVSESRAVLSWLWPIALTTLASSFPLSL